MRNMSDHIILIREGIKQRKVGRNTQVIMPKFAAHAARWRKAAYSAFTYPSPKMLTVMIRAIPAKRVRFLLTAEGRRSSSLNISLMMIAWLAAADVLAILRLHLNFLECGNSRRSIQMRPAEIMMASTEANSFGTTPWGSLMLAFSPIMIYIAFCDNVLQGSLKAAQKMHWQLPVVAAHCLQGRRKIRYWYTVKLLVFLNCACNWYWYRSQVRDEQRQ